jgi:hypothetical protein
LTDFFEITVSGDLKSSMILDPNIFHGFEILALTWYRTLSAELFRVNMIGPNG